MFNIVELKINKIERTEQITYYLPKLFHNVAGNQPELW